MHTRVGVPPSICWPLLPRMLLTRSTRRSGGSAMSVAPDWFRSDDQLFRAAADLQSCPRACALRAHDRTGWRQRCQLMGCGRDARLLQSLERYLPVLECGELRCSTNCFASHKTICIIHSCQHFVNTPYASTPLFPIYLSERGRICRKLLPLDGLAMLKVSSPGSTTPSVAKKLYGD